MGDHSRVGRGCCINKYYKSQKRRNGASIMCFWGLKKIYFKYGILDPDFESGSRRPLNLDPDPKHGLKNAGFGILYYKKSRNVRTRIQNPD